MGIFNILLVEDNEGDALLTKEALEETGIVYDVTVAIDGEHAIDYLSKAGNYVNNTQYPDLIFLDINLPKKNGQEVLQFIKSSPSLRHIPVIMLTTSSYENDINQSYDNHANCYVVKSVEIESFIISISNIINFWVNTVKLPTLNKEMSRR